MDIEKLKKANELLKTIEELEKIHLFYGKKFLVKCKFLDLETNSFIYIELRENLAVPIKSYILEQIKQHKLNLDNL